MRKQSHFSSSQLNQVCIVVFYTKLIHECRENCEAADLELIDKHLIREMEKYKYHLENFSKKTDPSTSIFVSNICLVILQATCVVQCIFLKYSAIVVNINF